MFKNVLKISFSIFLIISLVACGKQQTKTKTVNTTSKTVNQVMAEQIDNGRGTKVNPNDTANKKIAVGQVNNGSNLKRTTSKTTGKSLKASDIDIDLTRLNKTMVYSEVYNMMNEPEQYVGKMVRMNGAFACYEWPERNYYTCIIADATACCQQGIEFLWKGNHEFPKDYPEEGTDITVTGVFDIYYETAEDGTKNKYCQLIDASLVKGKA